jgi:hypothetical protein
MSAENPDLSNPSPSPQPSYQRGYHLDLYLRFREELALLVAQQVIHDFATLEPDWYGTHKNVVRGVRLLGNAPEDLLEQLQKILPWIKSCELGMRPYLRGVSTERVSIEYLPWTRNSIVSKGKLEGFKSFALEPGVRYILED